MDPFTVADATNSNFLPDGSGLPVIQAFGFAGINDTASKTMKNSPTGFAFSTSACGVSWGNLAIISRRELGGWFSLFSE